MPPATTSKTRDMLSIKAELAHREQLAPDHYLLKFICPPVAKQAQPGQFVSLRVTKGVDPLLRRPFSIMLANPAEGSFQLLVRTLGRGTKLLARTPLGTSLDLLGPVGQPFPLPDSAEQVLLVAGGLGVAPLIFLADKLKTRPIPCYVHALFGARTEEQLCGWLELSGRCDEFTAATEDGSAGETGLVTDLVPEKLAQGGVDQVYACGPVAMLAEAASQCVDRQIPCWVSLEQRMACGVGACLGCVIPTRAEGSQHYQRVCRDGPVFAASNIDWEAMTAELE